MRRNLELPFCISFFLCCPLVHQPPCPFKQTVSCNQIHLQICNWSSRPNGLVSLQLSTGCYLFSSSCQVVGATINSCRWHTKCCTNGGDFPIHPIHTCTVPSSQTIMMRRFQKLALKNLQELSIVFHQDWRQLLVQGQGLRQATTGGRVIYFYSNGSATANRGAEVCSPRERPLWYQSFILPPAGHPSVASCRPRLRNRILHREGRLDQRFLPCLHYVPPPAPLRWP